METRSGKYGRNLAIFLSSFLDTQSDSYRRRFLNELQTYSLEPRKKGASRNSGSITELERVDSINLNNPVHVARLVKEGIHLMYQKQTSRRVLYSLLENL